jgi:hypothetical protein|uniref:Uncharacterized protein n=1 Tax=Picea glauca TaxID=3330 RepID=A0A101M1Z2_PICGL|nr:hypothetical protein ABT39_MTgene2804 [Picea glauca]
MRDTKRKAREGRASHEEKGSKARKLHGRGSLGDQGMEGGEEVIEAILASNHSS